MTGAVVPYDSDTVIMYEHIEVEHGIAHLNTTPVKGQNVHRKGADRMKGDLVLSRDRKIAAADIGILASVGCSEVVVKRMPSIAVISTGDELVEINESPLPHQIRKSNAYQLYASLSSEGIQPLLLHVADDKDMIRQKLSYAVQEMDVLILSGGVSKGKFDFIPEIMEELGVEALFYKVMQRPGKPFWFGKKKGSRTLIFSFPGNPVSTFVCYHRYFRDWLRASLGLAVDEISVLLNEEIPALADLTQFIGVRSSWHEGKLVATRVKDNGSGDFMALAGTDGFICLEPRERPYGIGEVVAFVATRNIM